MEMEEAEVVPMVVVAAVAREQGSLLAFESARTEPFVSHLPLARSVQGSGVPVLAWSVAPMEFVSIPGWSVLFVFLSPWGLLKKS